MKSTLKRTMALPFSAVKFDSSSYSAYRPTYGPALYTQLYAYHKGGYDLAVDIGCGTGQITSVIAPKFKQVYGFDTSAKMLEAASKVDNIEYEVGNAEHLPKLKDHSIDLVTVGQAAHWFEHESWFKEMHRILKPDGTLSFWSYNEIQFTDLPKGSEIFNRYSHAQDGLGPHWPQPGRNILECAMEGIDPPRDLFKDIERHYTAQKGSNEPSPVNKSNVPLPMLELYFRTTAAFHNWRDINPDKKACKDGGAGDVIDEMLDEIKKEGGWSDEEKVNVHWPTVAVLARPKMDFMG